MMPFDCNKMTITNMSGLSEVTISLSRRVAISSLSRKITHQSMMTSDPTIVTPAETKPETEMEALKQVAAQVVASSMEGESSKPTAETAQSLMEEAQTASMAKNYEVAAEKLAMAVEIL